MMKLGVDYRPALFGRTGIGRTTRELCRAMAPLLERGEGMVLFGTAFRRPDADLLDHGRFATFTNVKVTAGRFPNRVLHLLGRMGLMGIERFTGPLDLFLYTDFVYTPLRSTPHVLFLYDLLFMDEGSGFHRPACCRRLATRVEAALARARGAVVPSQAVREDLERRFPGFRGPTAVVPLAGDHLPPPGGPAPGLPAPPAAGYFLSVGTLEPRKNRLGLLRAFERAAAQGLAGALYAAGPEGWLDEPFRKALRASPVKDRVHLLGCVEDNVLARLYREARALVYPSLGEGFGLPVAEAFHAGCPVITSNVTALPETAGEAALLVDPRDPEALAEALLRVERDEGLRNRLKEAGRRRAEALTWRKSAEALLAFLREVVREGKGGGPGEVRR